MCVHHEYAVHMNKVVYVSNEAVTWWNRAEAIAVKQGISMSKLVLRQLRAMVLDQQSAPRSPAEKLAEAQRLIAEATTEVGQEEER
jgi:hypothetical protein